MPRVEWTGFGRPGRGEVHGAVSSDTRTTGGASCFR